LLQYDNDKSELHSVNAFKFSSRSSFKSYSEKNDSDNQFCINLAIQSRTANYKKGSTPNAEEETSSRTSETPPKSQKGREAPAISILTADLN
jgi:hypothetical protein